MQKPLFDFILSKNKPSDPVQGTLNARLFTSGNIWLGQPKEGPKFTWSWWSENRDEKPLRSVEIINSREPEITVLNFEKSDTETGRHWDPHLDKFRAKFGEDIGLEIFKDHLENMVEMLQWYHDKFNMPIGKYVDIIPPTSYILGIKSRDQWVEDIYALGGYFKAKDGEYVKEMTGIYDVLDFHAPSLYSRTDNMIQMSAVIEQTLIAYKDIIKSTKPIYPFFKGQYTSNQRWGENIEFQNVIKLYGQINSLFDGTCMFQRRGTDWNNQVPYWVNLVKFINNPYS